MSSGRTTVVPLWMMVVLCIGFYAGGPAASNAWAAQYTWNTTSSGAIWSHKPNWFPYIGAYDWGFTFGNDTDAVFSSLSGSYTSTLDAAKPYHQRMVNTVKFASGTSNPVRTITIAPPSSGDQPRLTFIGTTNSGFWNETGSNTTVKTPC